MIQGSDEWRMAKLFHPSASRINAILAEGKGSEMATAREDYLYELACENITGIPYEQFHRIPSWIEDGKENEALARGTHEARTGLMVTEHPGKCDGPIPGFWASPDGLILPNGGLETKCPKTKKHMKTIRTGKIDTAYLYQMTGNLIVFEADWWDFVSFDPALPDNLCYWSKRFYRKDLPVKLVTDGIIQFMKELDALTEDLKNKEVMG